MTYLNLSRLTQAFVVSIGIGVMGMPVALAGDATSSSGPPSFNTYNKPDAETAEQAQRANRATTAQSADTAQNADSWDGMQNVGDLRLVCYEIQNPPSYVYDGDAERSCPGRYTRTSLSDWDGSWDDQAHMHCCKISKY